MNAVDRSQLLQSLHSRRDEIADSWYQAIARASDAPLKAEMRQRLVELTEQVSALLATDPFEYGEARVIGAALVHLVHIQPEALCQTQEVLVSQLVQGLPAGQVAALQPRLAALIGALAVGFFQRTREIMLTEHDQIRSTLIAKRKRAEEALRESKEKLRAQYKGIPIPTYTWQRVGEDFVLVDYNDAAEAITSGRISDFVGMKACEMYQDTPEILEEFSRCFTEKTFIEREMVYRLRSTGTSKHLAVKYTFVPPDLVLVHAEDITKCKQAEVQAAQSNRLAAMGWLAAALAHEINNPLQAIQANLELAMDFDLEPDEHEKYLHIVRQEVERLAEITRRVLDFARPADDTRYPVSIAHLVQKALQLVGKQLELAHIQATTDLPVDLPPVFVAPNQILQVLLNLSNNDIEVMPDGGHLHIAARADENMVKITLTNDGPPLPAEHIERVFDPFFTTKPNGAGLGLSISHSIIHRHGGTINVENLKDQRGVTFTITLPIARLGKEQEAVA